MRSEFFSQNETKIVTKYNFDSIKNLDIRTSNVLCMLMMISRGSNVKMKTLINSENSLECGYSIYVIFFILKVFG